MDYGRGESNAIAIIPDAWAEPSSAHDHDYPVTAVEPPARKPRAGPGAGESARAIGRMFFKTKLCCKFRAGTCPYPTNCNFAHGVQELRRPPPNWEEIVAAHHEASDPPPSTQQQREEHHIPIITPSSGGSGSGDGQSQRSYKGRRCKKFYTDETCPYGDTCSFLHDEQSRSRDSVAISLSPAEGGGGIQKPSNWKTRMCNKWEISGYCPFGTKCHFAHGAAELHQYGGGLVETEGRDAALVADSKHCGVLSKVQTDTALRSGISVPHVDNYQTGTPSNRPTAINPRQGQRPLHIWKGPDKISRIYGDWIDNLE